ncbi:MAG TPA: hypothetical protein VFI30_06110 [Nocardioidaceae bacterium]|nr:hypothetical protein [Nocardioidaceae bacterium]
MWWIILVVVVAAYVAYRFRVQILARVTGQSPARIQRALERRKGQ